MRLGYTRMVGGALLAALIGIFLVVGSTAGSTLVTIATYSPDRYELLKSKIGPSIEKKFPDIKLKLDCLPQAEYFAKLAVLAASEMAPDIFDATGCDVAEFAHAGALVSLDEYIKRDVQKEKFFGPPWAECRYPARSGKYFAVPYKWNTSVLFYNKDVFDVSGLHYPDDSWDWDAFLAAARKLTRDTNGDGKTDIWGFRGGAISTWYTFLDPLIRSFGGWVLNQERTQADLNNPGARKAMEFVFDMINKYRAAAPVGTNVTFPAGGAAMDIYGSFAMGYDAYQKIDFDWDVAVIPKGPSGRVTYGGSDAWMVMRRPKQELQAVWKVIKELVSEENIALLAGGSPPTLIQAFKDRWPHMKLPSSAKRVLVQSAPYMRDPDWSPKWRQWQPALRAELNQALTGQRSVEASLVAANVAINRILRDIGPAK